MEVLMGNAEKSRIISPKRWKQEDEVVATVKISGKKEHVDRLFSFLRTVQYLGEIGASRTTVFYVDGDGDCRLKFKIVEDEENNGYSYRPKRRVNMYILSSDDDPTLT